MGQERGDRGEQSCLPVHNAGQTIRLMHIWLMKCCSVKSLFNVLLTWECCLCLWWFSQLAIRVNHWLYLKCSPGFSGLSLYAGNMLLTRRNSTLQRRTRDWGRRVRCAMLDCGSIADIQTTLVSGWFGTVLSSQQFPQLLECGIKRVLSLSR